jgi:predicted amidophosphoribosyltransferase
MNKYGYHTGPEVCTYCGLNDFEDTLCCGCGKFIGESIEDFEQRLLDEEIESRR